MSKNRRLIRYGFITSERVCSLSLEHEHMLLGLLLSANDYGIAEWNAKMLWHDICGMRANESGFTLPDVQRFMIHVEELGIVKTYDDTRGRKLACIVNYGQKLAYKDTEYELPPDLQDEAEEPRFKNPSKKQVVKFATEQFGDTAKVRAAAERTFAEGKQCRWTYNGKRHHWEDIVRDACKAID